MKYKLCLTGLERVGKTSFAERVANNSFSERYKSTIGVKIFNYIYNENTEFIIWDIEGGKNSYLANSAYYRGSHAHLIVCDVTSEESIELIHHFFSHANENYYLTPIFLLLNKVDLMFSRPKIDAKIKDLPLIEPYFISCKNNIGIQNCLDSIFTRLNNNI